MNDIEILEEFIDYAKNVINDMEYERPVDVTIDGMEVLAIANLIQRNKDLEEIEREHKEENGRLREEVKKYETMIINHKKQLSKSGIYGYDYDLKILEESEK